MVIPVSIHGKSLNFTTPHALWGTGASPSTPTGPNMMVPDHTARQDPWVPLYGAPGPSFGSPRAPARSMRIPESRL